MNVNGTRDNQGSRRVNERGNIFFALFGAVALLTVLGVTVATFIKGPLSSSVKVTRMNVAESQMAVMAQAIIMQSSAAVNCDADAYVEPMPWQVPGAAPHPVNGGLIPLTASVSTSKDPWGTAYGYCSWDHGANSCGSAQRLAGASANADGQTVIALISAGPDKKFTTTCRTFAAADVNTNGQLGDAGDLAMVSKATSSDDDVIFSYSYREAAGAAGGLWTLKSTDEEAATIDKGLEVAGAGDFEGAGTFDDLIADVFSARSNSFIDILDGLQLPDRLAYDPACASGTEGVVRKNGSSVEMCAGGAWLSVTAGGGNVAVPDDTTAVCDADNIGALRYQSALDVPQFCNGSAWQSLVIQTPKAFVAISPSFIRTTVTGPCTTDCPRAHSTQQTVTVTNIGSAPTTTLDAFSSSGGVDFVGGATTCGPPLAPGDNCQIAFTVTAEENGNFFRDVAIVDNAGLPTVVYGGGLVQGAATGFPCAIGAKGWGGLVISCTNATTPNYVMNYAGCYNGTTDPDCMGSGSADPALNNHFAHSKPENMISTSGSQNAVNAPGYATSSGAQLYCSNLTQDGYDDWFLPSLNEWQTIIYPQRALLSFTTNIYWTSNYLDAQVAGGRFRAYTPSSNSVSDVEGSQIRRVRCLRRHATALPAKVNDTTPTVAYAGFGNIEWDVASGSIGYSYASFASQPMSSELYTVRSINTGVAISVSGSGSPTISINGQAPVTSGTIYNNDTFLISTTAPALGVENAITVNISAAAYVWRVRTPAGNTRRAFVTSSLHSGNLAGPTGADSQCQTRASSAGLSGNWYALLGTQASPIQARVPWNWNRLENMAGEVVAVNMGQLFYLGPPEEVRRSGLSAPIKYTQTGALSVASATVWTGLWIGNNSFGQSGTTGNCNNWTSNAGTGDKGRPFSTSEYWASGSNTLCNVTARLYCIGPF